MKNYYAIYPNLDGLAVKRLGVFDDFDGASEADDLDVQLTDRQWSIWIANQQDLRNLQLTIAESLI
jgi:hypothetical protein